VEELHFKKKKNFREAFVYFDTSLKLVSQRILEELKP